MRTYRFEMTSSDEGAFGFEPKRLGSNKTVVIEVNEDASLGEMLDHFKSFLSACDFCFEAEDYLTVQNDFKSDDNGNKFDESWDDQEELFQDASEIDAMVKSWFDTPEYHEAVALKEQGESIYVNDGSTLHVSGLNKQDVRDIYSVKDGLIKGSVV